MALYIGLMSGTSLDGVDGVLAEFASRGPSASPMGPAPASPPQPGDAALRILAHAHLPMPPQLRSELLALNRSGADELHRAALAANVLAERYAMAVHALLDEAALQASAVRAIGAHGQTVRHRPGEFDGTGYTLQLLNGALLAERCLIDVVCDLRSRDVAAGGLGAPLVPAFHAEMFERPGVAQAVLNLGGIGNLTLLDGHGGVGGFDCGPGNVLLDLWCERHHGLPFDDAGDWAATGTVDERLLRRLLAEPFFDRAPPKSTGRDLFDEDWLDAALADAAPRLRPENVQATLAELTARSVAQSLRRHQPDARGLLVCGGGALNRHLMTRLADLLPMLDVESTAAVGLPPLQVEAAAFAWLARAFVERRTGNRPDVTGAAGPRVLGALYPGA